jgi:hypothetical protein
MLGFRRGPQETEVRAGKKPALWAVSSEPLLGGLISGLHRSLCLQLQPTS